MSAFGASVKFKLYGIDSLTANDKAYLTTMFDVEFVKIIQDKLKAGMEIEIEVFGVYEDGDDKQCEVHIKEKKSGEGKVTAGNKVIGGGAGGSGSSEREIHVKGPCKEVKEIVKDLTKG
jgi:hypothetical protein